MILLHGLFGGLSNWNSVIKHFQRRFDVHVPRLPLYEKHKGDSLEFLLGFLEKTISAANMEDLILIGNSLGGHLALRYTERHPAKVEKLILTGSSGLYENARVGSFLKRGNYDYIKERVAYTFYDPLIATEELVQEVLKVTTDPFKCLCAIRFAKSAQRDNVKSRLHNIKTPVLLIWGRK